MSKIKCIKTYGNGVMRLHSRNGQYEVNFSFVVEFMPKKVYHVQNSYSKDVLKEFRKKIGIPVKN